MFRTVEKLILASGSPRRRDLLNDFGLLFEVETAEVVELPLPSETPSDFVLRISREKAEHISRKHHAAWVLAADTIVVVDNEILGKPEDSSHAKDMLWKLSGRSHEVWTGFCLCRLKDNVMVQQVVRTEVGFISLTDELCDAYIKTEEPLDKAGSYGIQGRGGFLVESIRGSYSNVVGLPLAEVMSEMQRLGIIAPATKSG